MIRTALSMIFLTGCYASEFEPGEASCEAMHARVIDLGCVTGSNRVLWDDLAVEQCAVRTDIDRECFVAAESCEDVEACR